MLVFLAQYNFYIYSTKNMLYVMYVGIEYESNTKCQGIGIFFKKAFSLGYFTNYCFLKWGFVAIASDFSLENIHK